MRLRALLFLIISFLLASCGNSVELKKGFSRDFEEGPSAKTLNFIDIKETIIQENCIQCHAGYTDYEVVFNDKDKILSAVLENRMPKNAPALDNDLKAALKNWIDAGAPSGPVKQEVASDELTATWSSLSKNVFFPKCVQCHNPKGQVSFFDLSTRQKFFEKRGELLNNFENAKDSYLLEVITDPEEPMPPISSGLERLNEKEIETIIEWIEKGLP